MTTGVPKEFGDKYQWMVWTFLYPKDMEKFEKRKKELKKDGFIVRTHYYSSLSAYALRAIRSKNLPSNDDRKEMLEWVKF